MKKVWNVAIYARVSTDKKEQQESIPAQVQSLKSWILEKNKSDCGSIYNLVEVYEDAGFSGSNFERYSFKRMKDDIEAKKINMVITRDLSRFGRDYLGTGEYLEKYFIMNGVRFISVLDNVDTMEEMNELIPIKNIFNEMYIRDCSKKSRDGLRQRMLRGSSIASKPLYGYKFDVQFNGNIKTIKLVPAEDETTRVVNLIFKLYRSGWGYSKIAAYLNESNIAPPASRLESFGRVKNRIWNSSTIGYILKNPKYGGMMIQQRWRKISYKIKKVEATKEQDWIFGGEFNGIIEKEIFLDVQKLIKARAKSYRYKEENVHPFSSVLRCNECGSRLSYRKAYKGYKCINSQKGGGRCTSHSIKEDYLLEIVTSNLIVCAERLINKENLYEYASKITSEKYDNKAELEDIRKQLSKFSIQLHQIYEDKFNGIINERNSHTLIKDIEGKQEKLLLREAQLGVLLDRKTSLQEYFKGVKDQVDKILSFEQVDRIVVESFIDRIAVTEDKVGKQKKIDIFYKFQL